MASADGKGTPGQLDCRLAPFGCFYAYQYRRAFGLYWTSNKAVWEISTMASSFCAFPTDGKGAVVRHEKTCAGLIVPSSPSPLQLHLLGQEPLRLCRTGLSRHYMKREPKRSVPCHCVHNMQLSPFSTNRLLQQSSKLPENGAQAVSIFFRTSAFAHIAEGFMRTK